MSVVLRRSRAIAALAALSLASALVAGPLPAVANTLPPPHPVKLVFVHHSTGEAWLGDTYGNLGIALRDNGYFVSDTNYGWGPDSIGDSTDVGNWWTWFRGPSSGTYTAALYAESGQNCSYSRRATDPGGSNEIVMFKSCFPNSNVEGSPSDTVPPISTNPLKGNSSPLTVGNAKGIYLDLLGYFQLHPEKLFVLVVSPPLRPADTSAENAVNARALANWLVDPNGWLKDYPLKNVIAWDFYTVLTGGHHRIVGGTVQHTAGATNYLAYPTGDSHPSATGDQIATAEFLPMLNAAYNRWKNVSLEPTGQAVLSKPSVSPASPAAGASFVVTGSILPTHAAGAEVRLEFWRRSGGRYRRWRAVRVRTTADSTSYQLSYRIRLGGSYAVRAFHVEPDHRVAYSRFTYFVIGP